MRAWSLATLGLLACRADDRKPTAPETEVESHEPNDPESDDCEVSWIDLGVGDDAIYVKADAQIGGDGSAKAPLGSIRDALDLEDPIVTVAIEAGTYVENIEVTSDRVVSLIGRCRDSVVIDGSEGGEGSDTVDVRDGAYLTLSRMTLTHGLYAGLLVKGAGVALENLRIVAEPAINSRRGVPYTAGVVMSDVTGVQARDLVIEGGDYGLFAYETGDGLLELDGLDVSTTSWGKTGLMFYIHAKGMVYASQVSGAYESGIGAYGRGTTLTVDSSTVMALRSEESTPHYGVNVREYAIATLTDSIVNGVMGVGLYVGNEAMLDVSGTTVSNTEAQQYDALGRYAFGALAANGATLTLDACTFESNAGSAVGVGGASLVMVDSRDDADSLIENTLEGDDLFPAYGIAVSSRDPDTYPCSVLVEDTVIRATEGPAFGIGGEGCIGELHSVSFEENRGPPLIEGDTSAISITDGACLMADQISVSRQTGFAVAVSGSSDCTWDDGEMAGWQRMNGVTIENLHSASDTPASAVVTQLGGLIAFTDLKVSAVEGPALCATAGFPFSAIYCEDCSLSAFEFAGAVAQDGGLVGLEHTSIDAEGADFGAWADSTRGIASMLLNNSSVVDARLAGVGIVGDGWTEVTESDLNTFPGAESRGVHILGAAVFAYNSTQPWSDDEFQGLRIEDSSLGLSTGPAILLVNSTATICGNSWEDNVVDVAWQGCSDTPAPDLCEGETAVTDACPEPAYGFIDPSSVDFSFDTTLLQPYVP